MKKGRSTYTFQLSCDPNLVNNLIHSYIQGNKYELQQKNGEQFYRAGDAMIQGYRYFNYSISGQTLTIYAWYKGALGEIPIEQSSLNMMVMAYRNSLNTLFQEIDKLNNGGANMNNSQMNFESNTGQALNQNLNNSQMNFDPNTGQALNQNLNNSQMNFDPSTGQALNQNLNNSQMNFDPNTGQSLNQNNYQQPIQNVDQFTQTFQNETTKKQEKMCEIGF